LKKLKVSELPALAKELRTFILRSVSKTGGHLASNLGAVELTIALLYCFDLPRDKIIWDVGHQSYAHKILTGRRTRFNTLRQTGGISGFPKRRESPYDFFNAGHASTSISAGLGFAKARDLKRQNFKVVSVVGDGALTGGLAFEGLNNAGQSETNFIVILNDNQMSINSNVGSVTRRLNELRANPKYHYIKKGTARILKKIPLAMRAVNRIKNAVRYSFIKGILFSELGFNYIGPVDGHNILELVKVLNEVKQLSGPILLHAYTKKGKGYKIAEKKPDKFHGVQPFDIKTGKPLKASEGKSYSDVFGETLTEMAAKDGRIVAISAAMTDGTGLTGFAQKFPDRFFDVGICEGHAATFAAGLAANGFIPFVAIYSTFLQRAYDNVLHDVCQNNLPVVFALDRAGLVGEDGETHHGLFDLSFLSHIPNMVIMAPRNKNEFIDMMSLATTLKSPSAIRYPKGVAPIGPLDSPPVFFGKSELAADNKSDLAIISVGDAFETAEKINEEIHIDLINARFVKPFDIDIIKKYKKVFIIENAAKTGGYFSLISTAANDYNLPVKVFGFGYPDSFIEHGSRESLQKKYGLDADSLREKILAELI
jgi:1-deoxy-D-xylulose-5-phosphate synthase